METRLDRFGRIVLPKGVREGFALEPGDTLEVRETSEGILLTPALDPLTGSPLRIVDGVLVFTGTATGDLGDAVAADRDARLRALSGKVRTKAGPRKGRAPR